MRIWIHLTISALALGAPAMALAQAPATPMLAHPAPSIRGEPKPLDLDELGQISGGQSIAAAITNQTLSAVATGNSITAGTVRSGDINFSQGALNNFAGVGNFVTNTGNNNILQGNLSVTVLAAPGALGR
jgi:hypothetical protein